MSAAAAAGDGAPGVPACLSRWTCVREAACSTSWLPTSLCSYSVFSPPFLAELNAGYAQNGNHCLATFTIKVGLRREEGSLVRVLPASEESRDVKVRPDSLPCSGHGNIRLACGYLQGNAAYLFICSANDKQWAEAEGKLRSMIQSFRA